jgi:hypothetical protein
LANRQLLGKRPGDSWPTAGLSVTLGEILPRVLFAQMQFGVLAAFQFRDVECGRTLTLLALHSCKRNQAAYRMGRDRRTIQNLRRKATGN